jgi:hypothetical protein
MQDVQAKIKKLLHEAEDCELIASDRPKEARTLQELAVDLRDMAPSGGDHDRKTGS